MVVGEGLADRHVRLLAKAIPEDSQELIRPLSVRPDVALAQPLFAPSTACFWRAIAVLTFRDAW